MYTDIYVFIFMYMRMFTSQIFYIHLYENCKLCVNMIISTPSRKRIEVYRILEPMSP